MLCLCYQQLACIIRRDNLSMARKRVRPVRLRAIRASKPGRPGRPPVHQETWSKVSVVLFDRQIVNLDRLAVDIRGKSGKVLNRAEIIRALIGRGLGSLAIEAFAKLRSAGQERAIEMLRCLELDQERWDIGDYSGITHLDNSRIRSAFRANTPEQARSMLQAVAALEAAQTEPYRTAALKRLATMDMSEQCHA